MFVSVRVCVHLRACVCLFDLKGLTVDTAKAAPSSEESSADMPTLVILGIALAALGLLLTNAALIAWLIIRKRNKGWLVLRFAR